VSRWTVVEKEQLLNYRAFIYYLSAMYGISLGSFVVGVFTREPVAFFLGALWLMGGALILYIGAGKFPNIDQAIEDAKEVENQ